MGTAGNFNVTLHFEASLRGGQPTISPLSLMYDAEGWPYHYQQFPEVSGVSPAQGSTAGGTLLTISGRGFPTSSLQLGQPVSVLVSDVPCVLRDSTYSQLRCVTGPAPASPPASATPIKGLYPGGRGAEYEFYFNTSVSYSQLWRLNSTVTTAASNASYAAVLQDEVAGLEFSSPNSCSRVKFFYTAPSAGPYRFYVQADDYAQLNGTWIQVRSSAWCGDVGGGAVCPSRTLARLRAPWAAGGMVGMCPSLRRRRGEEAAGQAAGCCGP